jgi:serine protease Do
MDRHFARGLAALLSITLATPAAAQTVGVTARRLPGDSVFWRAFGVGKMDTIIFLSRALGHEQYGSPTWLELTHKVDSLMAAFPRMTIRGEPFARSAMDVPTAMPRGWMGLNMQGPVVHLLDRDGDRVTYLGYPSILSVDPKSPADRAGIVPGDVVIAFNGTDVVGHEFNLSRLVVPDTKVAVTIRRDGETKDFSLDIARAPQGVFDRRIEFTRTPAFPLRSGAFGIVRVDPDKDDGEPGARASVTLRARGGIATPRNARIAGPLVAGRFTVIGPHAVFGADVSTVSDDLARVLKLEKGVLVNDVPEASPAYASGLRAGDVITSASGRPVATIAQLQDMVVSHFGERSVVFQVMRNRKPMNLTVTW